MAKNVLKSLDCELCGQSCKSTEGLSRHIRLKHDMSSLDYTYKVLLKGITPTCTCGCGKEVKVYSYKVNECYRGHSGGGNWQTKYDKDSEEYKTAVAKVSKSVKEYMVDNPPTFSEETKEKHSKYMKELLSDPEERERRRVKMQDTKIEQSKSGILSDKHFTKNKTKEEVDSIYHKIGKKASNTKAVKFESGELISWNKGKSKKTDVRIEKTSGNNHYRFNPDKDIQYTENFYDREYRKLLMEQQNGKCLKCGDSSKILCLHHVDEDKKNDDFENLVFVCRSCHSKIHNNEDTKNLFNKVVTTFKQNIILNKI